MGSPDGSDGKESACNAKKTQVRSLGGEDPLKKGMATNSSILSWRIPWTEGPDKLQSIEPQSPWDHKELNATQKLTLPFTFRSILIAKNFSKCLLCAKLVFYISHLFYPIRNLWRGLQPLLEMATLSSERLIGIPMLHSQ